MLEILGRLSLEIVNFYIVPPSSWFQGRSRWKYQKGSSHSYGYTLCETLDHTEIFVLERRNWPYSIALAHYMCAFLKGENKPGGKA